MSVINRNGKVVANAHERACQEYEARLEGERRKAREKYGEEAVTNLGGRPDVDVTDYLINELVGLNRYAEMLEFRMRALVSGHPKNKAVVNAARRGVALARQTFAHGGRLAVDLIAVRQELQDAGIGLGKPEVR